VIAGGVIGSQGLLVGQRAIPTLVAQNYCLV